jgi:glycosyltransferase involved in cell wall biosynthesis
MSRRVTQPLRITIATGPFYPTPPAPTGAVQRVWSDLAFRLAKRGHSVTVIACMYDGQKPDETVDGVRFIRRTSIKQGRNIYRDILKDSWYSFRAALIAPRADIIATNAFWLPIFARWLRPGAGKVYVTVQRVPKGQFWLYRGIHRFHAVSKAIADAIIAEQPAYASRVSLVPNPVDVAVFTPPAKPRLSDPSSPLIVFTGRVHPEKGLHVLVKAAAILKPKHPGLRLRFVGASKVEQGGGGREYVQQLESAAREAGVPLELSEPIFDRPKLATALQQADIYCYPSLAEKGEASPVAPVEAMATGLPPVVSDIPQFRDYLTPGVSGEIFDHRRDDNHVSLAKAIERLLVDPKRARAMGDAACTVAQSLSYEAVADRFIADFRMLLA